MGRGWGAHAGTGRRGRGAALSICARRLRGWVGGGVSPPPRGASGEGGAVGPPPVHRRSHRPPPLPRYRRLGASPHPRAWGQAAGLNYG